MILIVEGPDLSGKSYAIEKIAKHFNSGFVLKNSFKPKTLEDTKEIFGQYWSFMPFIVDREDIVILDRFFPSQAVYSIFRGEDHMKHGEVHALDTFCKEAGFLYVYIDTSSKRLQDRYDKRGDEHIKKEQLDMLKSRYDEFYFLTEMKKIKINTLDKDWLDKLEAWMYEILR